MGVRRSIPSPRSRSQREKPHPKTQLEIGAADDTGWVSNHATFRIALTTPLDCMKALLGALPNVFGDGLGTVDWTNATLEVISVA